MYTVGKVLKLLLSLLFHQYIMWQDQYSNINKLIMYVNELLIYLSWNTRLTELHWSYYNWNENKMHFHAAGLET